MKRALKASLPLGLPAGLGFALLLAAFLAPGCASDDDCVAGTARVRITLPATLMEPGMAARVEVVDATRVLGAANVTLNPSGSMGTADVSLPMYPAVGTPVLVQVFVTTPDGRGGRVVRATGLRETFVAGGCFAVSINLVGVADGGVAGDGGRDAGVAPTDGAAVSTDGPAAAPDTATSPVPDAMTHDSAGSPDAAVRADAAAADAGADAATD